MNVWTILMVLAIAAPIVWAIASASSEDGLRQRQLRREAAELRRIERWREAARSAPDYAGEAQRREHIERWRRGEELYHPDDPRRSDP
jgi:Ni/Co efflux regulator RcnB